MISVLWAVNAVTDNTSFRVITDGGILALLATSGRIVYVGGQVRQMVSDQGARIVRLEAARDAEMIAAFNGYRARDKRDA